MGSSPETRWVSLDGSDLSQVLSPDVLARQDWNVGAKDGEPFDPDKPTGSDAAVAIAVAALRGAVQNAGRCPLSVQEDSVPPGSVMHVLALAAWAFVRGRPSVVPVVLESMQSLSEARRKAEAWLERVRTGATVEEPSWPAGADYATPVSASNPSVDGAGVAWGDLYGDDADYAAGQRTDPASGQQVALPVDDMTVDGGGMVPEEAPATAPPPAVAKDQSGALYTITVSNGVLVAQPLSGQWPVSPVVVVDASGARYQVAVDNGVLVAEPIE